MNIDYLRVQGGHSRSRLDRYRGERLPACAGGTPAAVHQEEAPQTITCVCRGDTNCLSRSQRSPPDYLRMQGGHLNVRGVELLHRRLPAYAGGTRGIEFSTRLVLADYLRMQGGHLSVSSVELLHRRLPAYAGMTPLASVTLYP